MLNSLLHLVTSNTTAATRVVQALLTPFGSVEFNEAGKSLSFNFPGDEGLDKRNIYPHAVGNPAGTDLVGVKFSDDVNLLLARMRAVA